MSEPSPWEPRQERQDPAADESSPTSGVRTPETSDLTTEVPLSAPEPVPAAERAEVIDEVPARPEPGPPPQPDVESAAVPDGGSAADGADAALALGASVVLLALAGICALLGGHLLIGALRLAAGALAGAAVGAAVLAVPVAPARRRPRRLLAAATAVALALALTVPAVLVSRPPTLADGAAERLAPLGEDDVVLPVTAGPAQALIRRAGGEVEVITDAGVRRADSVAEAAVGVSADGRWLVEADEERTRTVLLDPTVSTADGALPERTVEGTPLALAGDVLVVRRCEDRTCRLSGMDLSGDEEPLWTVGDVPTARGVDPAGMPVPGRPAEPSGPLAALRATGSLPAVPLRFDPAQGWIQVDPATGFPVGQVLVRPDEECRVAVTGPSPEGGDPLLSDEGEWLVMTVCSGPEGELRVAAHQDGVRRWESDASPAGSWDVRIESGRVLAVGTEEGTDTEGEIIVTEQSPVWSAPGGEGIAQAAAFRVRVGIDTERMVVANDIGQLVGYDSADGRNLWTLPLSAPDAPVRGKLAAGTAAVLDPALREKALDPRGAQRLRLVDAATGEVTFAARIAGEIEEIHPIGGGRALVQRGDELLLLGP